MTFPDNIDEFNKVYTHEFLQDYIKSKNPNRNKFFERYFPKNGIVVEIGVDRGRNSQRIFDLLKPAKMYLVDAWDYYLTQTRYYTKNEILIAKQMFLTTQLHTMSLWENNEKVTIINLESTKAASNFEDSYFDLIYIDANHSFEAVTKDLIAWYPKLKQTGIIAGHDWNHLSVENAVKEFIKNYNIEGELYFADGDMYGDDGASDWAIIR